MSRGKDVIIPCNDYCEATDCKITLINIGARKGQKPVAVDISITGNQIDHDLDSVCFDTGAGYTLIPLSLAEKLQIDCSPPSGYQVSYGVGGVSFGFETVETIVILIEGDNGTCCAYINPFVQITTAPSIAAEASVFKKIPAKELDLMLPNIKEISKYSWKLSSSTEKHPLLGRRLKLENTNESDPRPWILIGRDWQKYFEPFTVRSDGFAFRQSTDSVRALELARDLLDSI